MTHRPMRTGVFALHRMVPAFAAAMLATLLAWPVQFVPPPPFDQLQTTSGLLGFVSGRSTPSMVIAGHSYACHYDRSSGAAGVCLPHLWRGPLTQVTARWYWHPQKWPFKKGRLLVHLTTQDGRTLLDYATQSAKLRETVRRHPPLELPQVAAVSLVTFIAVWAASFWFTPIKRS